MIQLPEQTDPYYSGSSDWNYADKTPTIRDLTGTTFSVSKCRHQVSFPEGLDNSWYYPIGTPLFSHDLEPSSWDKPISPLQMMAHEVVTLIGAFSKLTRAMSLVSLFARQPALMVPLLWACLLTSKYFPESRMTITVEQDHEIKGFDQVVIRVETQMDIEEAVDMEFEMMEDPLFVSFVQPVYGQILILPV